jgi:acetyl-CoA C-acetyltransferase
MTDAFIYDTVRTPRGKGRKDGALHEVTALEPGIAGAAGSMRDRNNLDTKIVDDVVFGCVDPVGEQGSNIARIAVLIADYAETTAGVQINRFCASGLEACNMAAAQVMSGQSDMDHRRRRREHEPRGMGASTAAPGRSIRDRDQVLLRAAGHSADLIATLVRLHA